MTAAQIAALPESAFALPSSYYTSVEVTPVIGPPEPTDWSVIDWVDGPTLVDGFWQRADRPESVGAVPAKEMGR